MKLRHMGFISGLVIALFSTSAWSSAYRLPSNQESLVGGMQKTVSKKGDSVINVAERYDIGFNAITSANPDIDPGYQFRPGTNLVIPTLHLLPSLPRTGIVINLPEMRLYYYPQGENGVLTYPIGIGKIGKTIPIKTTSIVRKQIDPSWHPTTSIREFNEKQGIILPKTMPAGPDNPLGRYAIYLTIPTYLIHSTIFPESVGKRASFGCTRMYESDIKDFFPSIEKNIPVVIINSPVKIGWQDNRLYMEAHKPLEEHNQASDNSLPGVVNLINTATQDQTTLIDWQLVAYLLKTRDGIPHEIGMKI